MEPMTPEKLAAIAKVHLGYRHSAPNSVVPNAYLVELKKHHLLYPHDLYFRVTLEPRLSYGKVTCLEKGCDALVVPLMARTSSRDGGLSEGLGSLSAYRFHIESHPTHAKSRLARVRAELAAKKGSVFGTTLTAAAPVAVKKEGSSLLNALDSSPLGAPKTMPRAFGSTPTPTQPQFLPGRRTSSLVRVKAEASEPKLAASHLNPVAAAVFASQTSSSSASHTPKRISSLVRVKPEPPLPEIPRKRLSDVAFGAAQGDKQTLSLTAKRPKVELTTKKPLSQVNRNTGSSGNVFAAPSAESIEDIRAKLVDVQREISVYESLMGRYNRKKRLSVADKSRLLSYSEKLSVLRRQRDSYNAAIPNVSPLKRTQSKSMLNFAAKAEANVANLGIPPPFNHPVFAQPKQTQPLASGSNARLPSACGSGAIPNAYMDDEDDLPAAVLQRIAPLIPAINPLGNADNFDENGDYFGRGRDTFVGPQAKADDIDKFLLEAGNAEQFDGNARVDQALEKLGLQTQYDLLPGMEVALMPHQTIGVAWMVEKEKTSLKGGCLGDDMGLGKTVQMIATIIKNKSEDPICKTNLIIAPMALLDQWKLEIEMKTNCGLKCLIYHGSSKPKRKQELLKYDVVLTTYSTMALEWPDLENEQKKKMKAKAKKNKPRDNFIVSDSDDDSDDPKPRKQRKEVGLLFQVDFYRIICDEAQAIRNRRTRTSRAVTDLTAMYRWCLTGTPIINSLVDVYGYLRFLKIRPWYDFTEFQSHIGVLEKRNPTLAVSRLQTVITTFLLRRMKDSMLDGKRLIELPDKTVSLVKLEFSEEERDIYQMVEARTQANFNRFLRAGTVLKNYSQVLVLLLRLRQICSHPSLIQEGEGAFIHPDEADDESSPVMSTELTRARRLVSPEFVSKMKEKFKTAAIERMAAEKLSADAVVEDEECPICFDALTDAVITPCTHIFCRDCLVDVLNTPNNVTADEPAKFKANERPCPACRSPICSDKLFTRTAFMPSDADLLPGADNTSDVEMADATASAKDRKGKSKAKPKKRARRLVLDSDDVLVSEAPSEDDDDDDDISDFIVEEGEDEEEKDARRKLKKRFGKRRAQVILDSDEEMEDSPAEQEVLFGKRAPVSPEAIKLMPKFLPSTKMKYMMEHLTKLVEEHPEEKTLVVSQWTGCLSLVSHYLTEKGVIHVKYQGDMNRMKRDQAVRVFMSKDKARVMLMSLKCGGVGLNLTRANNVISLDLGWSQAIEAQSFDRVHRLGQTRPVVVQRLVISDTVEDRVLAMQERKQQLADGSLGEGTGKKIGRLSVKELANLFGLDHRGRLLAHN